MKYSMNVLLFKCLLFGILLIKDVFICRWFYAHQMLTNLVRPLYDGLWIWCFYIYQIQTILGTPIQDNGRDINQLQTSDIYDCK